MKILMVCLGNICRSPLAEGVLKHKAAMAGLKWQIESAGTYDMNTGVEPHSLSQKVALMHGIDICAKRSRKFIAEDFDRFDKLYAMSEDVLDEMKIIAGKKYDSKKTTLLLNELFPGEDQNIDDPWSRPELAYHKAYELIDMACERIIDKYK